MFCTNCPKLLGVCLENTMFIIQVALCINREPAVIICLKQIAPHEKDNHIVSQESYELYASYMLKNPATDPTHSFPLVGL